MCLVSVESFTTELLVAGVSIQPCKHLIALKRKYKKCLIKILFINSICAFYNLIAHKLNPNHPQKNDCEQCCPH